MTFYVKAWDTDEILSEHKALPLARRACRAEGHTGYQSGYWFVPNAYVANEHGECVYNPRFATSIGAALSTLTVGPDDCLRG